MLIANPTHPLNVFSSFTYFDQRTHNIANHVVQKSVGRDCDLETRYSVYGFGHKLKTFDCPNRRGTLSAFAFKTREIVFADQSLGRVNHCLNIQPSRNKPASPKSQRILNSTVLNVIQVRFLDRVPDRMKAFGGGFDFQDRDVERRFRVERAKNSFIVQFAFRFEAANLRQSMHARVGSAAGRDPRFFTGDPLPRFFESLLNRNPVDLDLPPDVSQFRRKRSLA